MWYDSKKQNILEEWNSAKVKRKTCSGFTDCQILYKNALFKETPLLELILKEPTQRLLLYIVHKKENMVCLHFPAKLT